MFDILKVLAGAVFGAIFAWQIAAHHFQAALDVSEGNVARLATAIDQRNAKIKAQAWMIAEKTALANLALAGANKEAAVVTVRALKILKFVPAPGEDYDKASLAVIRESLKK